MRGHRKTRFRPQVETVEGRQLLSTAVVEVLNQSSYKLTFDFRWGSNYAWTAVNEAPGQGYLFWTTYSNSLHPQVIYAPTTSPGSQMTVSLAQGYNPWNGSGNPPASAAKLYEFLNSGTGDTLYYIPPTEPATATGYSPAYGSLFGPNGPSYLDVQQGSAGDCWLMASLAEVAARDPQDIRNMFTYEGNTAVNGALVGLYRVRFFSPSGVPEYVNVDTELPAGGTYYDRTTSYFTHNNILWVALAEKAYAEASGYGYVRTSYLPSDSYSALDGGDPAWALQAITGKPASDFSVNPSNIAAAWNSGELIVLGTANPSSSYIVGDHAYAVVGYNPSSSMPYQVYNPWGTTSSGWAQGTYNGKPVYGLFVANGAFLSQNFIDQAIGFGAAQTDSSAGTVGNPSQDQDRLSAADSSSIRTTQGRHVELGERTVIDPMRVFHRKGSKAFMPFATSM
jgi:hypothetical protein